MDKTVRDLTNDEARVEITRKVSDWRTICEVHRDMYDLAEDLPVIMKGQLQTWIIESFIMAKKMNEKLRSYRSDWDSGLWQPNDLTNMSARRLHTARKIIEKRT